jgi:hypothetical protein
MKRGCSFPKQNLDRLRQVASGEPRLAALYVFGLQREGDCDLAALFTEAMPWPERLDLEMAIAAALDLEGVELVNLRRMPLVLRFGVINEGDPLYVGHPETLAMFIEHTIARYSSFYPLLEALYWKVETGPLADDQLDQWPLADDQ